MNLLTGNQSCGYEESGVEYKLSQHAEHVIKEREISMPWIEKVVFQAEKSESDRFDPELEHRLGRILEYGNRVLRVVIVKGTDPMRIVTAYFDRKMRGEL